MQKKVKIELNNFIKQTMSKNVRTGDQLIKVIEMQGGITSANYTPNYEADQVRRQNHVKIMMALLKQLAFENWHEVTLENLDSWIQKIHKLKKKDF